MTPRTSRRRALCAPLGLLALALTLALAMSHADAASIAERTLRVSTDQTGSSADGASSNAVLSGTGRFVAYDTAATNVTDVGDPNGPIRDVVLVDTASRERRLVTAGGDGASFDPAISSDGRRVAFMSQATNLVAGDANGVTDVFWREGVGPVVRVSIAEDGSEADGPSSQPDISGDGRRIVFTSAASNLVPGDDNGRPDVFVRDLVTGRTVRVSEGESGTSSAPAISSDGRWVSFFSSSRDLVEDDRNGRADVFVRSLVTGETELVSVSSGGRQQNRSIAAPFAQVSDLSGTGRYVVFDSDATNLVEGDTNRDSDVFLRDRREGTTERVSVSSAGRQGDNDSFNPTITVNGRYVGMESFAENFQRSAVREDVFVHDRRLDTMSLLNVGQDNRPRGPESVRQLLQRPAVSEDGRVGVFTSTSGVLSAGDANGAEDVFLRRLDAPRGMITARPRSGRDARPSITLAADDPAATRFLCRVDRGPAFDCPTGTSRLPRLSGGAHVLTVRAGGLGMLYDPARVTARFTIEGATIRRVSRAGPRVRIRRPRGGSVRTIRGTARGPRAIGRVEVAVIYFVRNNTCRHLSTRRRFVLKSCSRAPTYVRAQGGRSWRLRLPRSITGPTLISARATDRAGNRGRTAVVRTVLRR